jgi:hypothetical protein
MREKYPAIFANPETEAEFRMAINYLMDTVGTLGRITVGSDIFVNLRNFMLQDIARLRRNLDQDQWSGEELKRRLVVNPLGGFVRGGPERPRGLLCEWQDLQRARFGSCEAGDCNGRLH